MSRTGKIARLAFEVREEINRRLLDNQNGVKIIEWINTSQNLSGAAAINDGNLSEWRAGGFAEWLGGQEKIQRTQQLAEYCRRVAEAGGGEMNLPAAMVGGQLMEVMEDFDPAALKTLLQDNPASWIELVDKVAKLQRAKAAEKVAGQGDVKLEQSGRALALAEAQFQVKTCELFLKWRDNKEAEKIAADKTKKPEVKIAQLRALMFGEVEENAPG